MQRNYRAAMDGCYRVMDDQQPGSGWIYVDNLFMGFR